MSEKKSAKKTVKKTASKAAGKTVKKSAKKVARKTAAPTSNKATADESPKPAGKSIFKNPPAKPAPWSFGGRGGRGKDAPQGKPMADAERRRAMSRKVH